MHYIIVGAGPSGVIACETLRKLDQSAQITLLTGQKEPPYSRMAIPYFLEEQITESGTYLRHNSEHFSTQNISVISELVSEVHTDDNSVLLSDGNKLAYDKLLIASGAAAILPPIDGIGSANVHNCWTLEDARNIAEKAVPGSSLVLMGAGFIGCIILQSLLKRGVNLTVVEMGERMVPRMMDDTAGALLKSWCESKGVKILTGEQVTSICETESTQKEALKVNLKNSEPLFADLLICAAGVKSNTVFLENSKIKLDQGILVNQFLQTNIDNVYAAGDAARGLNFSDQSWNVQAIQPTAVEHGRIAAINMVQNNSCVHHGSINMNILDTMGLISTSFGQWMGVENAEGVREESILLDEKNYRYINLQFNGDHLVGISTLGHTQHIGVVRGLIRGKVNLGIWKERLMKDPSRLMEAYLANL